MPGANAAEIGYEVDGAEKYTEENCPELHDINGIAEPSNPQCIPIMVDDMSTINDDPIDNIYAVDQEYSPEISNFKDAGDEYAVPEIQEGIVEIKSVAREPGNRSKIAVWSKDESVDPVGSCVGYRGMRVQAIVDELGSEKIDIVKWSEDPAKFIANALSPSKVVSVAVNEAEKVSRVVVPDYQLSLAIGKEGQNARLAAKLTGWKIDIKSESQAADEELDENMNVVEVESDEAFTAEGE